MSDKKFVNTFWTEDADRFIEMEVCLDIDDTVPYGIKSQGSEDIIYISEKDMTAFIKELKELQARRKVG